MEREWKRAAAAAIAPARFAAERDAIAAELGRRLWRANGGAAWSTAGNEGSLLALEMVVARYLSDGVVRASLGLKHLQALEAVRRDADYEDTPPMTAEIDWAEQFFMATAFAARETAGGVSAEAAVADSRPEPVAYRMEAFLQELTALVQAELKAAEIAA